MKKKNTCSCYGLCLIVCILTVLSCSIVSTGETDCSRGLPENETIGQLQFELTSGESRGNNNIQDARSVILTIENDQNESLYELKKLDLVNMNGYLITKPISLPIGKYRLTRFIVVDQDEKPLFATPLKDSPLSYLVNEPLAIDFSILKDNVLKIIPEVIDLTEVVPTDIGYTTFTFKIITTIEFLLSVFVYDSQVENYQLTDATVDIYGGEERSYHGNLDAETNILIVPGVFDQYEIVINKRGYDEWRKLFTRDELITYWERPLIVCLNKQKAVIEGLIAYYPFSGNANDESGNNNHGTIHGATLTQDRTGTPDNAYHFDGISQYISFPNESFDFQDNPHALSLWMNINGYTADDGIINFEGANTDNDEYMYTYKLQINQAGELEYRAAVNVPGDDRVFGIRVPIETNVWHHIVAQRTGNTWQLYINGEFIAEDSWDGMLDKPESVFIGRANYNHKWFNGMIDDIRIYNRALSNEEIGVLFHSEQI